MQFAIRCRIGFSATARVPARRLKRFQSTRTQERRTAHAIAKCSDEAILHGESRAPSFSCFLIFAAAFRIPRDLFARVASSRPSLAVRHAHQKCATERKEQHQRANRQS